MKIVKFRIFGPFKNFEHLTNIADQKFYKGIVLSHLKKLENRDLPTDILFIVKTLLFDVPNASSDTPEDKENRIML